MTTLTVSGDVSKLCPYKNERDDGTVTLVFEVGGDDGPELHDLAQHLRAMRDVAVSHEQFSRDLLATYAEFDCVEVTGRWQTAGLTVTCRTVR